MKTLMSIKVFDSADGWEKSDSVIWKGKNNRFFRLGKNNLLYSSTDLKEWEEDVRGWQDINSRWLKLQNNNLYWSSNKRGWIVLEPKRWTSPGGVVYLLNENLELYVKIERRYNYINTQN